MNGFSIYTVDTGVGTDVYYADSYSYETEGKRLDGSGVILVVFRAKNGRDKGKVTKMPLHRVDRIVDNTLEQVDSMTVQDYTEVTCPGCGAELPGPDRTAKNTPVTGRKTPLAALPFEHPRLWCQGCGGSAVRLGPVLAETRALSIIDELKTNAVTPEMKADFSVLRRAIMDLAVADPHRPKGGKRD